MAIIRATIGIRVKSGWAVAVGLAGSVRSPRVFDRHFFQLSDPNVPETKQPYHARIGTLEEDRSKIEQRTRIIRRVTAQSVGELLKSYGSSGYSIRKAVLVVGSDIDPGVIANQHIRAHALEGRLFRTELEKALRSHRIVVTTIVERNCYAKARDLLKSSEGKLRRTLVDMRPPSSGPWRSEEKMATLAAWMSLS